jgi:hypothetical protein
LTTIIEVQPFVQGLFPRPLCQESFLETTYYQ